MKKKKLWFRAKKYGWGWYPITWQGWATIGVYILYQFGLVAFIGKSFDSRPGISSFLLLTFFGVIILLAVCYKYGEEPRWRWGK